MFDGLYRNTILKLTGTMLAGATRWESDCGMPQRVDLFNSRSGKGCRSDARDSVECKEFVKHFIEFLHYIYAESKTA